jgi:suppressor of fused-like protein
MTEANNRSYVGIDGIVSTCSKVYPDQLNPTQATSVVKYWYSYLRGSVLELFIDFFRLGGSECLDYISIYHNQGNETSSAHWHYVTFGFSDLHGDGRVHK